MRLHELDDYELSWPVIVECGLKSVHNNKNGVRIGDTFFYVSDGVVYESNIHETVFENKRFVDLPNEAFIPREVKHKFKKLMTGGKQVKAAIALYLDLLQKEKAGTRKAPRSALNTAASVFNLDPRDLKSEIQKAGL